VKDYEATPAYAIPECAPFLLENSGTECCLCIHGFTGCPALFMPLGETLFALGYSVSAPLLPGHGTSPEDLSGVSELEWFRAAARELESLLGRYGTVHLVGLSLGGAIASWLAAEYANNAGLGRLVLLSPGFGLAEKKFYSVDYEASQDMLIPLPRRPSRGDGMDASRYGYPAMSLKSVGQLILATERAKSSLGSIRARAMALYTSADAVADPEECAKAIAAIPSMARVHRYEGGEHNLLLGPDRADVIGRIMTFLAFRA